MNTSDLDALLPELERFHERFARYFCRAEGRAWAKKYLTGLVMPIERKNVENVAERVGAPARKLQEFVSDSPWDDVGCIDELQRFVAEQLGAEDGVLIIDDTGFAKKGTSSAGVGRQYSGTLGRVDNCQIGVFLGYACSKGHTLVDRRLYVMEPWFTDTSRQRSKAALPLDLTFQTKHQLALAMLQGAHDAGHLPYQWVTGDAAYGDSHDLRQAVTELGKWYCFEVSSNTEVWQADPKWEVSTLAGTRGRPPSRPHPTKSSPPAITVAKLATVLPPRKWKRHRVIEGAKGPREYEFARMRVVEKQHHGVGPAAWMMARRPVGGTAADAKYYLSNAPETVALAQLAYVGCLRWTIEENFELAKGKVGLDHYEVTKHRGWYHHMTMSLMALAFLKSVQRSWSKKPADGERPRDPSAVRGGAALSRMEPHRRTHMVPRSAAPQARRLPQSPAALAA